MSNRLPGIIVWPMPLIILVASLLQVLAQGRPLAVQLEALASQEAALRRVAELKESGVEAYLVRSEIPGKGVLFRVRVGKFSAPAAARRMGQELQSRNLASDFFVTAWESPYSGADAAEQVAKIETTPLAAPAVTTARPSTTTRETAPARGAGPGREAPAATAPTRQNVPAAPRATTASPAGTALARTAPATVPAARTYVRFTDPSIGYSFEHPQSWEGGVIASREANEQNINAGALFRSSPDRSFLNVIWNQLDQANSPDHDNDMIVELILRSMSSGEGTREMKETARRVVSANGQIRTYLDLRARFDLPGNPANLDFSGKAVIVRNTRGILLVVTFFSNGAPADVPPDLPAVADRILASVTLP